MEGRALLLCMGSATSTMGARPLAGERGGCGAAGVGRSPHGVHAVIFRFSLRRANRGVPHRAMPLANPPPRREILSGRCRSPLRDALDIARPDGLVSAFRAYPPLPTSRAAVWDPTASATSRPVSATETPNQGPLGGWCESHEALRSGDPLRCRYSSVARRNERRRSPRFRKRHSSASRC
jgi:hypothetical protein